jgi:pyruvate,water dikinase
MPDQEDPVERVQNEERAALQALAAPEGTVWSRYNLSEVLPEPTPMTWAIVTRLLSGRGGLGLMYRDLGCTPDPKLDHQSIFDLICGRPYCNLSREPLMQLYGLPFEHSFAALKAAPELAFYPRAKVNAAKAGMHIWRHLPRLLIATTRFHFRLRKLSRVFATHFRHEIVPAYTRALETEAERNLGQFSNESLIQYFEEWTSRIVVDFARESFKPTALADLALSSIEQGLCSTLDSEGTRSLIVRLCQGIPPDADTNLAGAMHDLANGRITQGQFLERFGHRGPQEMELAQPRWSTLLPSFDLPRHELTSPPGHYPAKVWWEKIAREAKLGEALEERLAPEVEALFTFVPLRDYAKHFLMFGFAHLRRCLLEVDRRLQGKGDVFYLTPSEIASRTPVNDLLTIANSRRQRRELALSISVPPVLFSDDLNAIGRPIAGPKTTKRRGTPLSVGSARAAALVLTAPTLSEVPDHPFILVCSSTDPAWVPLFARAAGLVMETGGILSHGAIVAREFRLPAVAGLPGITQQLHSGQKISIDGTTGEVEFTLV